MALAKPEVACAHVAAVQAFIDQWRSHCDLMMGGENLCVRGLDRRLVDASMTDILDTSVESAECIVRCC